MKKADSTVMFVSLALLTAPVAVGCSTDDTNDPPPQKMLAASAGAPQATKLVVYPNPYSTPMTPSTQANPVPESAVGVVQLFDAGGGKMRITLKVQGMVAGRAFGSHLHKLPCEDPMKAGGHYQHVPFPAGGMATDPNYANIVNEAWLDFVTDTNGVGVTDLTLNWIPRAGEAKAVIIHDMLSGGGGVSGAKLACLNITGI